MRWALVGVLVFPAAAAAQNQSPPTPPLEYPGGSAIIHNRQPTIILENVDDPDGDVVDYFIEVDQDPCFCSTGVQSSGPLSEGDLVTQWQPARPLTAVLVPGDANRCEYFIRRWASDGELESARELSVFEVIPCDEGHVEPDGDADADADGDADADADTDPDDGDADGDGEGKRVTYGCCAVAGRGDPGLAVAAIALLGLVLARRRPRR